MWIVGKHKFLASENTEKIVNTQTCKGLKYLVVLVLRYNCISSQSVPQFSFDNKMVGSIWLNKIYQISICM